MGAKPVETPMDPNVRLCVDQGELLSSPYSYQSYVKSSDYVISTLQLEGS